MATAKLNFEGTTQYHQAGIMVYGDDDNFTKFGRIAHTHGRRREVRVHQRGQRGRRATTAADSTANIPADFPDDFWLRLTSDGTNVIGHYSTDGTDVDPGRASGGAAGERQDRPVRVLATTARGNPVAAFDSFTLTGDAVGGGGGTPSGPSYDDQFDGATLDKTRWNAIVRDTPAAVHGGRRRAHASPPSPGDIYTGDTTPPPNNFILQDAAHAGADWVIETKINATRSTAATPRAA